MRERDYLYRGVQIMPVIKARPPARGGGGGGSGGGGEGMRAICILDQAYFLKNARRSRTLNSHLRGIPRVEEL